MRSGSARGLSALRDLRLQDIPDEGLRLEEPLPRAWLQERLASSHGLDWSPQGDGQLDLEVSALGPVDQEPPIRLHGRVSAQLQTDCVRCLESVDQNVEARIDLTLFSASESGEPEGGAEDANVGRYEGRVIPVPEVLREHLLLELDMNPVCADASACDERTRALIDRANQPARDAEAAEERAPDPRWAALRDLRVADDDD